MKELDCLYLALRKLNKLIGDEALELFSELEIHPSYAYILKVVNDNDVMKTRDISIKLTLDSSTVTRMVNKLVEQGYLKKGNKESKTDIYLTKKGLDIMPQIEEKWVTFHDKYDIKELLDVVNKTIEVLEKN